MHNPRDLAMAVQADIRRRRKRSPALRVLDELCETLFEASLKTEEGRLVSCHVIYLDPENPDPHPPRSIRRHRWTAVYFKDRIPFTTQNIVKLAKASDPRTSSLAVYKNDLNGIVVWGLIDQGNEAYYFNNFESDGGFEWPGLFQVSIAGLGHLIAHVGFNKIAELRANVLFTKVSDVFWKGPIRRYLGSSIEDAIARVANQPRVDSDVYGKHWKRSVKESKGLIGWHWVATLCRLLFRVRSFNHGGAILFTRDEELTDLNIKYRIDYSRLCRALDNRMSSSIENSDADEKIVDIISDLDNESLPISLHLREAISANDLDDSESELDGTLWFVSLLSRVDGLILMRPDLSVVGFGVEITCSDEPSNLFLAQDPEAREARLRPLNYQHFGTRHRSMLRYCGKHPGSVGFVISQDGEVRAMTKVGNRLVVWENLKLQLFDFVPKSRRTRDPRETRGV
jgi:hypothetical protein